MKCPHCNSIRLRKKGTRKSKQRFLCNDCRKQFSVPIHEVYPSKAKILLLDIETAPMEVYVWDLRDNNYINYDNIIKDWNVICYSAKWLNDSHYIGDCQTSKEAKNRDDSRILKSVWKLLDQADVVIGHNVEKFDLRKLNARFLANDFASPPLPYQTIDTLKHSRKIAAQSSHAQGYLTRLLKLPEKLETNFGLWKRCVQGEQKALDEMYNYCNHDVGGLEEVYLKLRAWMRSHPNLALYGDLTTEQCPVCESTNLGWNGNYVTPMNIYDSFRCKNCGHISRARTGTLTKHEKLNLTRSTAR